MRIVVLFLFVCLYLHADSPKLFLLKTYKHDTNLTGWVMSEKLDGVRAFWDGKKLISRSGRVFHPSHIFTQDFPPFALDGELWTKREDFEHIVSIVNSKDAQERWSELTYNVFEVPKQDGDLFDRLDILTSYLKEHPNTRISIIPQLKINKQSDMDAFYAKVISLKGEGIVVRDPSLAYYVGRRADALKHKPFMDEECRVISVLEGKGKFIGQMGAVECEFNEKIIKIGSGFTDKQREKGLKIGTIVSFKYYGLTHLGNPKYPVFLRIRLEE